KLREQIADYRRKVTISPKVEQESRELTRGYEGAQMKYREVSAKQMEAQLAQNLEANRKGERFTLIEPPLPPEQPVSPNRPALLALGVVLTLGCSIGIVALLETLDITVRGKRDMQAVFVSSQLALIPRIVTEAEQLATRRRRRMALGATAAAFAAGVLVV